MCIWISVLQKLFKVSIVIIHRLVQILAMGPQKAGWTLSDFDNSSPYSIMFGPDKCGLTNKVHFIFCHKNPKSMEYSEHHLKAPPVPKIDKFTHVYSAIITLNNTLQILIDGKEVKTANLLSSKDFDPPVMPQPTLPDPDDKKPSDWDDRAKIPDPEASKPDDWDDDAPREIIDAGAVKPVVHTLIPCSRSLCSPKGICLHEHS